MFRQMFSFEWRYFTRQPSFYIISILLGTLAFLITSLNTVQMGGANLLKNGPYSITYVTLFFLPLCMFLVVNFMANAALRDPQCRMDEILYCLPLRSGTYQLGRFFGAFCVILLVFAAVPAGLFLGTLMPWVDPSRLGPIHFEHYLRVYFGFAVPTLFVLAALFYALAKYFQSLTAVYLSVLVLLIGYEASDSLLKSPHLASFAALLDPFGIQLFEAMSRYWTVFEKNNQVVVFSSLFFTNRILWLGIGVGIMALFGGFFRNLGLGQKLKKPRPQTHQEDAVSSPTSLVGVSGDATPNHLRSLLSQIKFEAKLTLKSLPFLIIVVLAMTLLLLLFIEPSGMYGTPYWPVTFRMIDTLQKGLHLFALVIITYYSSEVLWRDSQHEFKEILDVLPVPPWVFWWAKIFSVWSILFVLLGASMVLALLFQAASGYYHFEWSQYAVRLLFFTALPWMMFTVLAFFISSLFNNKYLGMFGFILFFFMDAGLDALGWHHHLLHFAQSPDLEYSDMNGYGGSLIRHFWYMLFWGGTCVLLVLLCFRFRQLKSPKSIWKRRREYGKFWSTRVLQVVLPAVFLMLVSASVIVYHTRILNQDRPLNRRVAERAAYEKTYGVRSLEPIPSIKNVFAKVDIFPERRRVEGRLEIEVENQSNQPIERSFVSFPAFSAEFEIVLEGGYLEPEAGPMGTHEFVFKPAMKPGETRKGHIRVVRQQRGFSDGLEDVQVVPNGTFLNNMELFPWFGYRPDFPLAEAHQRKRFDLPPANRAHLLEDSEFHNQSFFGQGSDFITFEAVISTSPDQIAMTPGYLQKEWLESDRRYFHYKMEAPMVNYYSITSAVLDVVKTEHHGVAIEVLHHPQHGWTVPNMLAATKATLDYCSQAFGPYQHRQVRIIEYPRYRTFAQSFANTIPFSEQGFLFDTRNPQSIDPAFKVTAHELAHQWWGHQVGAANVQGANTIIESLTQYSALMVMKNQFGEGVLRRQLVYELNGYLRGRTREPLAELPLMRSEDQGYIHYQKGSIVMLALWDLMGEARLNQVLKTFLHEFQYASSPYPTTSDLLKHLAQNTRPEEWELVQNWFQKIEIFDLKITAGTIQPLDSGEFEVLLTIQAHRFEADSEGREIETPFSEMLDIALALERPDSPTPNQPALYRAKHLLQQGQNHIRIVLQQRPAFACVDPLIKRIDRDSDDNIFAFK